MAPRGHTLLVDAIAAHLATWAPGPAHVELAIFGSDDPQAIAAALDGFCVRELGSAITRALFYQSSVGSVAGVLLGDGRHVVVKAHQPTPGIEWQREIVRLQRHLAAQQCYATTVLAGPTPFGHGNATAEAFAEDGVHADAHRPEIRRALARALFEIVEACRPLVAGSTLTPHPLGGPAIDGLWPSPHSKLFDFAATRRGAEWIDEVAAAARARRVEAGELVLGHGDWRAEHVRFVGDRPVVAFDWDSLGKDREPALVGVTAHAFCADWTRNEEIAPAPTLEEARAFVSEYEVARGRPFDRAERALCGATFAFSCAYTARCGHALGHDEREAPGTFMHLVAKEGLRLLTL